VDQKGLALHVLSPNALCEKSVNQHPTIDAPSRPGSTR
jgi:hypothetical protein